MDTQAILTPDDEPTVRLIDALSNAIGGDISDLRLLRRGTNVVLMSESVGLVFRVQDARSESAICDNLALVRDAEAAGAPFLGPESRRPYLFDAHCVTIWPHGESGGPNSGAALGSALAELHRCPADSRLRPFEIDTRIERRLQLLPPDLPNRVRSALDQRIRKAKELLAAAFTDRPSVFLHGDAHDRNIASLNGKPLLIDLDDLCVGPAEIDLVPTYVAYRRMNRDDAAWAEFISHYNRPVDWSLVEQLAVVREVTMNTWLASIYRTSPRHRAELAHRLRTWDATPGEHDPWRAL